MRFRPSAVQLIAWFLSVLLFTSNTVLAYSPETNFWKERSKQTQAEPLQYASLPTLPSFPNASIGNPATLKTLDPRLQISGMTTLEIPAAFGSIRKISPFAKASGDKSNSRILIHIQDVHLNAEAQTNIGKTVQALIASGKVDLIALEGAFAPIDLKDIRAFKDKDSITKVADYLLRANKISGAVHAGFITPSKKLPAFIGIDDKIHYDANVESYRNSVADADKKKKAIRRGREALAQKKKEVFNPELAALDTRVEAHRNGTLGLGDYVKGFPAPSRSLAIDTFLQAYEMERSLNFKVVEAERSRLLNDLVKKLTETQISELTQVTMAYRASDVRHADFYAYLKNLCGQRGIELARYPAMNSYLQYVLLSDSIDADKLTKEINAMEKAALKTAAKTNEEKALVEQSKQLYLAGKLVEFALTKDEWKEYRSNPDLKSFEAFYSEAEFRDSAMSKNLLRAMDEKKAKVTILITGGFHSSGIQDIVRGGITTVSFVPKITKVEDESGTAYLSVFSQEKTPLDKLFAGEKLFLPPSPAQLGLAQPMMQGHVAAKASADLTSNTKLADGTLEMKLERGTNDIRKVTFHLAAMSRLRMGWNKFIGWLNSFQFPLEFSQELIPNLDGTASEQTSWKWIGIRSEMRAKGSTSRKNTTPHSKDNKPAAEPGQISDELARKILDANVRSIGLSGKPGAGKGTQGEALIRDLNEAFRRIAPDKKAEYLSTGDYFSGINRVLMNPLDPGKFPLQEGDIENYGPLAKMVPEKELRERLYVGKLMSDQTTVKILNKILTRDKYKNAAIIIFDGFPRTVEQLKLVDSGDIKIDGRPILWDLNILIEGDNNIFAERLIQRPVEEFKAGKRRADTPLDSNGQIDIPALRKLALKRLDIYDDNTKPVVDVIRSKPNTIVVNGNLNAAEAIREQNEKLAAYFSAKPSQIRNSAANAHNESSQAPIHPAQKLLSAAIESIRFRDYNAAINRASRALDIVVERSKFGLSAEESIQNEYMRVKILGLLGEAHINASPGKAIEFLNMADQLATALLGLKNLGKDMTDRIQEKERHILISKTIVHNDLGEYDKTIAILTGPPFTQENNLADSSRRNWTATRNLLIALERTGRSDEALSLILEGAPSQRAIKNSFSGISLVTYLAAEILYYRGEFEEARRLLTGQTDGLQIDRKFASDVPSSIPLLALIVNAMGEHEKALVITDSAPKSRKQEKNMAIVAILMSQGKTGNAAGLLRLTEFPHIADLKIQYARLSLALGQTNDAITTLGQDVASKQPKLKRVFEQNVRAKEIFEKALAANASTDTAPVTHNPQSKITSLILAGLIALSAAISSLAQPSNPAALPQAPPITSFTALTNAYPRMNFSELASARADNLEKVDLISTGIDLGFKKFHRSLLGQVTTPDMMPNILIPEKMFFGGGESGSLYTINFMPGLPGAAVFGDKGQSNSEITNRIANQIFEFLTHEVLKMHLPELKRNPRWKNWWDQWIQANDLTFLKTVKDGYEQNSRNIGGFLGYLDAKKKDEVELLTLTYLPRFSKEGVVARDIASVSATNTYYRNIYGLIDQLVEGNAIQASENFSSRTIFTVAGLLAAAFIIRKLLTRKSTVILIGFLTMALVPNGFSQSMDLVQPHQANGIGGAALLFFVIGMINPFRKLFGGKKAAESSPLADNPETVIKVLKANERIKTNTGAEQLKLLPAIGDGVFSIYLEADAGANLVGAWNGFSDYDLKYLGLALIELMTNQYANDSSEAGTQVKANLARMFFTINGDEFTTTLTEDGTMTFTPKSVADQPLVEEPKSTMRLRPKGWTEPAPAAAILESATANQPDEKTIIKSSLDHWKNVVAENIDIRSERDRLVAPKQLVLTSRLKARTLVETVREGFEFKLQRVDEYTATVYPTVLTVKSDDKSQIKLRAHLNLMETKYKGTPEVFWEGLTTEDLVNLALLVIRNEVLTSQGDQEANEQLWVNLNAAKENKFAEYKLAVQISAVDARLIVRIVPIAENLPLVLDDKPIEAAPEVETPPAAPQPSKSTLPEELPPAAPDTRLHLKTEHLLPLKQAITKAEKKSDFFTLEELLALLPQGDQAAEPLRKALQALYDLPKPYTAKPLTAIVAEEKLNDAEAAIFGALVESNMMKEKPKPVGAESDGRWLSPFTEQRHFTGSSFYLFVVAQVAWLIVSPLSLLLGAQITGLATMPYVMAQLPIAIFLIVNFPKITAKLMKDGPLDRLMETHKGRFDYQVGMYLSPSEREQAWAEYKEYLTKVFFVFEGGTFGLGALALIASTFSLSFFDSVPLMQVIPLVSFVIGNLGGMGLHLWNNAFERWSYKNMSHVKLAASATGNGFQLPKALLETEIKTLNFLPAAMSHLSRKLHVNTVEQLLNLPARTLLEMPSHGIKKVERVRELIEKALKRHDSTLSMPIDFENTASLNRPLRDFIQFTKPAVDKEKIAAELARDASKLAHLNRDAIATNVLGWKLVHNKLTEQKDQFALDLLHQLALNPKISLESLTAKMGIALSNRVHEIEITSKISALEELLNPDQHGKDFREPILDRVADALDRLQRELATPLPLAMTDNPDAALPEFKDLHSVGEVRFNQEQVARLVEILSKPSSLNHNDRFLHLLSKFPFGSDNIRLKIDLMHSLASLWMVLDSNEFSKQEFLTGMLKSPSAEGVRIMAVKEGSLNGAQSAFYKQISPDQPHAIVIDQATLNNLHKAKRLMGDGMMYFSLLAERVWVHEFFHSPPKEWTLASIQQEELRIMELEKKYFDVSENYFKKGAVEKKLGDLAAHSYPTYKAIAAPTRFRVHRADADRFTPDQPRTDKEFVTRTYAKVQPDGALPMADKPAGPKEFLGVQDIKNILPPDSNEAILLIVLDRNPKDLPFHLIRSMGNIDTLILAAEALTQKIEEKMPSHILMPKLNSIHIRLKGIKQEVERKLIRKAPHYKLPVWISLFFLLSGLTLSAVETAAENPGATSITPPWLELSVRISEGLGALFTVAGFVIVIYQLWEGKIREDREQLLRENRENDDDFREILTTKKDFDPFIDLPQKMKDEKKFSYKPHQIQNFYEVFEQAFSDLYEMDSTKKLSRIERKLWARWDFRIREFLEWKNFREYAKRYFESKQDEEIDVDFKNYINAEIRNVEGEIAKLTPPLAASADSKWYRPITEQAYFFVGSSIIYFPLSMLYAAFKNKTGLPGSKYMDPTSRKFVESHEQRFDEIRKRAPHGEAELKIGEYRTYLQDRFKKFSQITFITSNIYGIAVIGLSWTFNLGPQLDISPITTILASLLAGSYMGNIHNIGVHYINNWFFPFDPNGLRLPAAGSSRIILTPGNFRPIKLTRGEIQFLQDKNLHRAIQIHTLDDLVEYRWNLVVNNTRIAVAIGILDKVDAHLEKIKKSVISIQLPPAVLQHSINDIAGIPEPLKQELNRFEIKTVADFLHSSRECLWQIPNYEEGQTQRMANAVLSFLQSTDARIMMEIKNDKTRFAETLKIDSNSAKLRTALVKSTESPLPDRAGTNQKRSGAARYTLRSNGAFDDLKLSDEAVEWLERKRIVTIDQLIKERGAFSHLGVPALITVEILEKLDAYLKADSPLHDFILGEDFLSQDIGADMGEPGYLDSLRQEGIDTFGKLLHLPLQGIQMFTKANVRGSKSSAGATRFLNHLEQRLRSHNPQIRLKVDHPHTRLIEAIRVTSALILAASLFYFDFVPQNANAGSSASWAALAGLVVVKRAQTKTGEKPELGVEDLLKEIPGRYQREKWLIRRLSHLEKANSEILPHYWADRLGIVRNARSFIEAKQAEYEFEGPLAASLIHLKKIEIEITPTSALVGQALGRHLVSSLAADRISDLLTFAPLKLNISNSLDEKRGGYRGLSAEAIQETAYAIGQERINQKISKEIKRSEARIALLALDKKSPTADQPLTELMVKSDFLYAPRSHKDSEKRRSETAMVLKVGLALKAGQVLYLAGNEKEMKTHKNLLERIIKNRIEIIPIKDLYHGGSLNLDMLLATFDKQFPKKLGSTKIGIQNAEYKLSAETADYFESENIPVSVIMVEQLINNALGSVQMNLNYLLDLQTLVTALTQA